MHIKLFISSKKLLQAKTKSLSIALFQILATCILTYILNFVSTTEVFSLVTDVQVLKLLLFKTNSSYSITQ